MSKVDVNKDTAVRLFLRHYTCSISDTSPLLCHWQSPVFRFLKTSFPGLIKWNFDGLFLVNRQGVMSAPGMANSPR